MRSVETESTNRRSEMKRKSLSCDKITHEPKFRVVRIITVVHCVVLLTLVLLTIGSTLHPRNPRPKCLTGKCRIRGADASRSSYTTLKFECRPFLLNSYCCRYCTAWLNKLEGGGIKCGAIQIPSVPPTLPPSHPPSLPLPMGCGSPF